MLTIREPPAEGRSSSALGEPQFKGAFRSLVQANRQLSYLAGGERWSCSLSTGGAELGHWPPSGDVQCKNRCGRQSGFPSNSWVGKNRSGALSFQALLKVGGM